MHTGPPSGSIIPWWGEVWRAHHYKYRGDTTGGSRLFSGRYNCGLDMCSAGADWDVEHQVGQVWEALYTGLSWGICLAEFTRHLTAATLRSRLKGVRFAQLRLELTAVLDCTNLAAVGVAEDDLFRDGDYTAGQALARAARAQGCKALLVPSAARIPGNDALVMIVFPDTLQPASTLRVVRTMAPQLTTGHP